MEKVNWKSFEASVLRASVLEGEEIKPYKVMYEVLKGSGVLKREEVIDKISNIFNIDKEEVKKVISGELNKMKKAGLIENVSHGNWKF